MTLLPGYVTTPCRGCGKPVFFVTDCEGKRQVLDARPPIFVRQRDGDGGAIWARDTSGEIAVSHFATCPKANDFSGRNRGQEPT